MMLASQISILAQVLFLLTVSELVRVVDGGACATMSSLLLKIPEDATAGTTKVSWPHDGIIVNNFDWVTQTCGNYFNVTSTGLVTIGNFDLESANSSSVSLSQCSYSCKDETMPSQGPRYNFVLLIHVEAINEFPPVFSRKIYDINVTEMTPVGYVVFEANEISVSDRDVGDGISRYSLGIVANNAFHMETPQEGKIAVASDLDYEIGPKMYTTSIFAYDNGLTFGNELTGSATLVFHVQDVDDQSPAFSALRYSLNVQEENSSLANSPLFTTPPLHAFDQDYGINSTVFYRLLPVSQSAPPALVNLYNKFSVDSVTGAMEINSVLDREQILHDGISQPIILHIQAYENTTRHRSNRTTVRVTVTDTDDNLPEFSPPSYTAEIAEHSLTGSTVVYITATDKDEGPNAAFDYKLLNATEYFHVEGNETGPGRILVQNSTALDRETNPNIWMRVGTSTDKALSNTAIVEVLLRDINDNAPVFGETEYHFEIKNNTHPRVGDIMGKVSATDKDDGENSRITYTFGNPGVENYLSIDQTSGEITVAHTPLPLEGEIATMEFFVKATDHGDPSFQTVAHVKIVQYSDDIRFYLYTGVPADPIIRDNASLQSNFSTILGVGVTIKEVVPDNTGGVDLSRSRLQLTAKYPNGTQLTRKELKRLTTENYSEIQALFDAYKLTQPATTQPAATQPALTQPAPTPPDDGISPAEIALIVIAGVVLITAILVILVFCRMHRKIKRLSRVGEIMSRRSTLYESQEFKLEIMAETSDYDKSESLEDEDLIENVEDGDSMTRWNPVFTGDDNVANLSEVTELKKYYTYPRVRGSNESGFVGEDTQQQTDDPNEEEVSTDTEQNPTYVNVTDAGEESLDTATKASNDEPTDDNPVVAAETEALEEGSGDNPLRAVSPETSKTEEKVPLTEPEATGSPPKSEGPLPADGSDRPFTSPLTSQGEDPEPPLPPPPASLLNNYDPIEDYDMHTENESLPETVPESIASEPVPDYAQVIRRQKPTENYDLKIESNSLPETVPESVASEPEPDYSHLSPLPEPKPDYTKVSFSDTAIAIDADNKVEVIKQVLGEAEIVDDESSEPGDDISKDDPSASVGSSDDSSDEEPIVNNGDQALDDETPSTSGLLPDKSDPPKAEVVPSTESETKPKVNGFVNGAFIPDAQEDGHFYFTEQLTRF